MSNKQTKFKPINEEIVALAQEYHQRPEHLLDIFMEYQAQHGGLSRGVIQDTARALHLPAAHAYGIASFYSMLSLKPGKEQVIRVCDGPVCWMKHATPVRKSLDDEIKKHPNCRVERTSCLGLCDRAPAVLIDDNQAGPINPEDANRVINGWRGENTDYSVPRPGELRIMLANSGVIDPDSIHSAIEKGAYQGLRAALEKSPDEVVSIVEASGLTGRGGAGFPVGRKWRFVAQANRQPKYIICNADESEPLIFKDRVLMDTNPHQVLEGMVISGYATGASVGYIYIRGEYLGQAQRMERAIAQAEEMGFLGNNIQESGFSFQIHVHRGAGAYICGEETALIESLEGKRGEPRFRPPYPPSSGNRGLPTLVNNVESYAAVPSILQHGAEWYRALSRYPIPGTKLYMLLGHIKNPGLFEAPFGLSLRQVIEEYAGGMIDGSEFHFALTGGAAGTIVSSAQMDIPIDYASAAKGISLGAGAFLIANQDVSTVAFLRELLHFFTVESCGKCTPCRVGTRQALTILERLATGGGISGDLEQLYQLSDVMQVASFCGLGQSVAIPVKSALANFADEFKAAIQ